MSIQDWAAIAEIVSAVAIVVTLIYLALQIRNSNRETRANTIQTAISNELEVAAVIASHAGIWDKVVTNDLLDDAVERRTGIVLYNLVMTEAENRYYQYRSGYLDVQAWEGRVASLRMLVRMNIYEPWKRSPGARGHSADFLGLLESLQESGTGK